MSFSHKYNSDDVLIRAHIVGLVNELNNKINFENVWEDGRKETVKVPFFYAMSGDERFLQDYFSNWSDCAPNFIEGNTDPIPRGTIMLSGVSVLGSNLTSRYVRGYYTKEIDGELKRFNSYINSIPIQLNFSAEIIADTMTDIFKIVQSVIATFFRTVTFSINFKGFRIPIQAGFPESYSIDKQFEFTYGETNRLKTIFDIEAQGFFPIPDQANERNAGSGIIETVETPPVSILPFSPRILGDPPITGSPRVDWDVKTQGNTGNTGGSPPPKYFEPPSDPNGDSSNSGWGSHRKDDLGNGSNGGDDQDNTSRFGPGYWR